MKNLVYAEQIDFIEGQQYDVEKSESESIKMLSSAAKEAGVWLLGGTATLQSSERRGICSRSAGTGSISERDTGGHLYNTATVYSPSVSYDLHLLQILINTCFTGFVRFGT
jgi:omega-amidase